MILFIFELVAFAFVWNISILFLFFLCLFVFIVVRIHFSILWILNNICTKKCFKESMSSQPKILKHIITNWKWTIAYVLIAIKGIYMRDTSCHSLHIFLTLYVLSVITTLTKVPQNLPIILLQKRKERFLWRFFINFYSF